MSEPGRGDAKTDVRSASVGHLTAQVASDFSHLLREEIELAKVETKQEATKAARGAGVLTGSGLAGYGVLLFASVALMFLLATAIPTGWAAFIVAVLHALLAGVLYAVGRRELKSVSPTPRTTAARRGG